MDLVHAHVWVSGRVQGVGYRYYTLQQAKQLGLRGWVRNLPDGRVEAVFEGELAVVERMIEWCWQGSKAAIVSKVDVKVGEWENIQGFEVKREFL